jgi:hypothetical protein
MGLAIALLIFGIIVLIALILLGGVLSRGQEATPQATTLGVPVQPSITPSTGDWVVTFEYRFPDRSWSIGQHTYTLQAACPNLPSLGGTWTLGFEVSTQAQVFAGWVYLRTRGLSDQPIDGSFFSQIHPDQALAAAFSLVLQSREEAEQARVDCSVTVVLDGGPAHLLAPHVPYQR